MRSCSRHAITAIGLLALAGCGRPRPPAREQTAPQQKPLPAAVHEIEETTMRFADPKGRWKLELKADRVEAATVHGPYDMTPAAARYEEVGKAPVSMVAKRAHVDESARRVTFEGDVVVASPAWRLDADRVEYDLKSGEVAASGHTKWTFTEGSAPVAGSSRGEGKP